MSLNWWCRQWSSSRRGLRRDPPLGARQPAPFADAVAHALDHPHQLILLSVFVGRPVSIIETQLGLLRSLLAGGGDRGDERDAPAAVDDAVGGLAVLIELPVPRRVLVRRVQDRLFEKPLLHVCRLPGISGASNVPLMPARVPRRVCHPIACTATSPSHPLFPVGLYQPSDLTCSACGPPRISPSPPARQPFSR